MTEQNLELWVARLNNQEMPVFKRTVQQITGVAEREDTSFAELARGILRDPSLTARVLRMSNSIHYNPSASRINTISRAVMRLGFDTVRSMCLAVALVEGLLKGTHKERVSMELARAFHAAVQAKKFVAIIKEGSPEEAFIAALLSRLGHIAFWCFAGEIGKRLAIAMNKPGATQEQAEQQTLGFRLQRLTKRLAEEWRLSSLLEATLDANTAADPRVQAILLAQKLATAVEQGWDSAEAKRTIKEIAEYLKIPESEAVKIIHDNANDAAEVAETNGLNLARGLIPLPSQAGGKAPRLVYQGDTPFPEPDHLLQLNILRELSSLMLNKKLDINLLLSILLEGISRGIGMDRVLFALLTPDRRQIKGKYGLGWASEQVEEFSANAMPLKGNIFSHALKSREPLWVKVEGPSHYAHLLTEDVLDFTGNTSFFIMPIMVKDQAIGIIYADRKLSGRKLDEEGFASFTFFGQQANLSLSSLAN